MPYDEVRFIDFRSASKKSKDIALVRPPPPPTPAQVPRNMDIKPSMEEPAELKQLTFDCEPSAACLKICPEHYRNYRPAFMELPPDLPSTLKSKEKYTFDELLEKGDYTITLSL